MRTPVFALSLRMLLRDWRAGELRILAAALVIAVGSVTAVAFFTDRVRQGMAQQAGELLAADLVVASADPIRGELAEQASRRHLKVARTVTFRSVVLAGDETQLVEVKAAGPGYPLRGQLRTADALFGPEQGTDALPAPRTLWVEPRLLSLLRLEVGQSMELGALRLPVTHLLTYEPDRGGDLFSIAPRVLVNLEDLAATGLITRGSRAQYHLLVAGEPTAVADYRRWLRGALKPGEQVLDLREGRPELRVALERAEQYLGLAALTSVLLAGVAVVTAARRYSMRHLDTSAMMRCLGATQATVVSVYALGVLWMALLASALGCLVGLAAQAGLAQILGRYLLSSLPAPSAAPAVFGFVTGIVTLVGFAVPPLLELRHAPPLRVLRRDLGPQRGRTGWLYVSVIATVVGLIIWQVRAPALVAYVVAGTAGVFLGLGLAAWLLVRLLRRLRTRVGIAWRFGFANIARRPRSSVVQIVAFGLGIMVLLLLSLVRTDLLASWRQSVPAKAPNQFMINIQPQQVAPLQTQLRELGPGPATLYPMVRARLAEINGKPVRAEDYPEGRARRLVTREFNLSWAGRPQIDNRIVAGRWWRESDRGRHLLSFEQELAQTLGLRLGDVLTFDVAGRAVDLTISNLRTVEWDSFNVNFFAVVPPGVLEGYPAQWITSIYVPSAERGKLARIVKRFPNVTVIDVDALMARVRTIIERVALAVEFVFLFTLLAGLAVLYAAIQSHQDERRFESAMLVTLGAPRRQLWRGLIAEFATLGCLAGLLGGTGASVLAYVLATHVFHLGFQLNPWVPMLGMLAGALGVGLAGVLGTLGAVRSPPLRTLRRA